ncbi:MAG: hypothetical protein HMLKMBBP_03871 [Planctomycetes bacterium]|nr:hypothetical protein [Planctomycetota bacterium]
MRRGPFLLVVLACAVAACLVIVLARGSPPTPRSGASSAATVSDGNATRQEAPPRDPRRPRPTRVRTESAPVPPRIDEPAPAPDLRATVDIGEKDEAVTLTATIRPDDPASDARPVPVSLTMDPATTRLTVTLGVVPDPGSVRVLGQMQQTTHAPDGANMASGVVTTDPELLTIDEPSGLVHGVSNSLGSARQVAGVTHTLDGKPSGRSTAWGRVRIAFAVRGSRHTLTVSVPRFESYRPRRLDLLDGAGRTPGPR